MFGSSLKALATSAVYLVLAASCGGATTRDGDGADREPRPNPTPGPGSDPQPTPTEYTNCTTSIECRLVSAACCESCEDQTIADYAAVNGAYSGSAAPDVVCDGAACNRCEHDSPASHRGAFGAACEAGRCVAFDVRESPLSECPTDPAASAGACVLRAGLDCCERCDLSTGFTAVRSDVDFSAAKGCPSVVCPPCEPTFPRSVTALCGLEPGRCSVFYSLR